MFPKWCRIELSLHVLPRNELSVIISFLMYTSLLWYGMVFKVAVAMSHVISDLNSSQWSGKWFWKATDTVNYCFFLCVIVMNFKNKGIRGLLGSNCNLIYTYIKAESKTHLKSDFFVYRTWEGTLFNMFCNGSLVIQRKETSCWKKKKSSLTCIRNTDCNFVNRIW